MKVTFSEERLLEAVENQQIIEVPLDWVNIDDNVREHSEEAIEALANSIEQIGQITPGTTTTDGIVFEGVGRVLALRKLRRDTFRTGIIESGMSRSDWIIGQLSTAIHTETAKDVDIYNGLMKIVNLRTDIKQVDLARLFGVKEPKISVWLSPSKITEKGREAFSAGLIRFSETSLLARLPYEVQDEVLAGKLSGAIPTRDALYREVRERTRKPSRNGHAAGKNRCNVPLPSGNQASFIGPLKTVTDLREAGREFVKQCDKAIREDIEDIKVFQAWLKAKDKS